VVVGITKAAVALSRLGCCPQFVHTGSLERLIESLSSSLIKPVK
jgi:hypothetical protein